MLRVTVQSCMNTRHIQISCACALSVIEIVCMNNEDDSSHVFDVCGVLMMAVITFSDKPTAVYFRPAMRAIRYASEQDNDITWHQ